MASCRVQEILKKISSDEIVFVVRLGVRGGEAGFRCFSSAEHGYGCSARMRWTTLEGYILTLTPYEVGNAL